MKKILFVLVSVLLAMPASAQVGVAPASSPFRDITNRMEVTLFSGIFNGDLDPVGISPQDGPMIGGRYDYRLGSVLTLSGRVAMVRSGRNIIDPLANEGERLIGKMDHNLYLVDVGGTLNITGAKSFHNIAPVAMASVGTASDLEPIDNGGYEFGTRLMFTVGGGLRWLIGDQWQLRGDVTNYMYQVRYPPTYYEDAEDGTQARTRAETLYTHNLALTLGLSFRFFR